MLVHLLSAVLLFSCTYSVYCSQDQSTQDLVNRRIVRLAKRPHPLQGRFPACIRHPTANGGLKRPSLLNLSDYEPASRDNAAGFHDLYSLCSLDDQKYNKLGQGVHGRVYRAVEKATGQLVAVKQQLPGSKSDMAKEAEILSRLKGLPYVLQFEGFFKNVQLSDGMYSDLLITELVENGEPMHRVFGRLHPDNDKHIIIDLLIQLFAGINGIHSRGYKHLDIKADNVLAACSVSALGPTTAPKKYTVTIIDFGLAVEADAPRVFREACIYMAPEVCPPAGKGSTDAKADIWSACAMIVHLFGGSVIMQPTVYDLADFLSSLRGADQADHRAKADQLFAGLEGYDKVRAAVSAYLVEKGKPVTGEFCADMDAIMELPMEECLDFFIGEDSYGGSGEDDEEATTSQDGSDDKAKDTREDEPQPHDATERDDKDEPNPEDGEKSEEKEPEEQEEEEKQVEQGEHESEERDKQEQEEEEEEEESEEVSIDQQKRDDPHGAMQLYGLYKAMTEEVIDYSQTPAYLHPLLQKGFISDPQQRPTAEEMLNELLKLSMM